MEENLTVAVTPLADRAFKDGRKRDREKGSMGERQTLSPRQRAGRVWASQSARRDQTNCIDSKVQASLTHTHLAPQTQMRSNP